MLPAVACCLAGRRVHSQAASHPPPPGFYFLASRIKDDSFRRTLAYMLILLAALSLRTTVGNHLWKTGLRTHWYIF